ncbi:palmitoyltransferase ZDHHC18-A isoform X1 [Carassius gibelio]|uniref:palmitoyltransferase ZDHHC18-A isoform X1 n=1 Tax=Carassius gibelio TaxID=101364 RepID=UPI002278BE50|nr:palmitoyltransferase ZDHHC18-A isoform X1 [Carassius gibelio]
MKNCEYRQIDLRALTTSTTRTSTDKTLQRVRRKWEVFPGKNRFYCDGRIMLARQCGVLPLTIVLIFMTSGLFFRFDCPFLVHHLTVFIPVIGGVLFLFVVITLLQTSLTDPGILPRALPDEAADIEKQIDNSRSSTYRPPPRTKEILINDQVVKLKYCFTCKMFRPPRTSHCSLCDNCVERFDHHCPWVGNCVGKRNYRFFYAFIVSLSFLTSFIFGCVITHLTLIRSEVGLFSYQLLSSTGSQRVNGIIQAIKESPASVVELVICFFSIWSILGLSGFHTYLVASNLTTNEDIKGSWSSKRGEESGNPYTYNNIFTNCCVVLCGPMQPSLIDRRGFLPPDDAPPIVTSDTELPYFMAKKDTNMCTQGTKELLESVAHSAVIQSTCTPGTPKTTPVTQESLPSTFSITVSPSSKSPSAGCSIDVPCSQRGNKQAALHNHKTMLRVSSPPFSLGHSPIILSDAPDMGFIPLN